MEPVIKIEKVCKTYKIYHKAAERYLDFFLPLKFGDDFYALKDIDISVPKGKALALIGLNGSGKSTLANLIAGISMPSSGTIQTYGKVSMSSISAGINPRLTGIENINLKCLMLGLSHKDIKKITPEIISFSELEQFIDQPVKTYSSGMRSKLGFSIAVNIDPEILVIDESLSVGDPTFTDKCLHKMNQFRKSDKTIIFVSHSMQQVRDFCDEAVWLEGGKAKMIGTCSEVSDAYEHFIKDFNRRSADEKKLYLSNIRDQQFVSRRKNGK